MTTRGIFHIRTCTCGTNYLSDTTWVDGRLEYVDQACEGCRGQGVLL